MRYARGLTLIELVITIALVSLAAGAVLAAMASSSVGSARAMTQFQATAIAEAYLEEILLRPFADPDGVDGETARADLDDVDDYHGLADSGARDQYGNVIAGLEPYDVAVSVQSSGALPSVPASGARLVSVTVQPPQGVSVTLTAYRTDY